MKRVLLVVAFVGSILFSQHSLGQAAGDFRSFQSGNWSDVSTWERYDGATWVNPAPNAPSSSDGVITILAGHTVTDLSGVTADQVVVNNGGVLVIDGVTFTVAAGSGDDMTINSGGILNIVNGGTLQIQNTVVPPPPKVALVRVYGTINSAGTISNASASTLIFESGAVYDHKHTTSPGIIPDASWDANSTCMITGYTSNSAAPSGLGQNFGNFVWDTPGLTSYIDLGGGITTVNGNLTISNVPSSYVYLTATTNYTLTIGGDFTVSNSFLGLNSSATATINVGGNALFSNNGDLNPTYSGNLTLDISGNLEFSGGTVNFTYGGGGDVSINVGGDFTLSSSPSINNGGTGVYTLTFDGSSAQTYTASQAFTDFDFLIKNGSVVNIPNGSYMAGSGAFTLEAGGTLGVQDVNGLNTGTTSGNIRVAGARNYTANGNIIYNGTAAQVLGNEWGASGSLNGVAVNLEIDNASGVTNDIIGGASLVGDLTLTNGALHIGNSNSLDVQSNFNVGNGTIGGLSSSNLTFSGSGTMGTLTFATGAQELNNLTIARTGDLVLGSALTISGTLALTGNLDFSGQDLTVTGSIDGSAGGGLKSNNASNLTISGSGFSGSIPFAGTGNELNNLILESTGATYNWGAAVTINNTLNLAQGTLNNNSGLTMGSGSTLLKGAGTLAVNSPNAVSSYHVTYVVGGTTGLELPSSATALANLTVSVSGSVDLASDVTVNGDLNLNSGTLNAGANNFTMAGSNWTANGGTFTIDAASTVTMATAGTLTMGGSSIGGTQFGNLTINSGTTVSAPDANLNISGTWNNQGTFTPNNGTVTFNGANQNIDANGQPFNSVVFAGSGTKSLISSLTATGSLTINSGITLDAAAAANTINVSGSWTNSGTFVPSGNTVVFNGTNQSIDNSGQSFYNLQFSGSGTKTLAGALDVNNNLTIDAGVTLNTGASAYPITLAGNWTNNGTFTANTATVTFDGTTVIGGSSTTDFHGVVIAGTVTAPAGNMNVAGDWLNTGSTFNANGGTVTFNGANQDITSAGQAFANVVIAGTNDKTLQDNLDVNGNLTLNSGTLNVGLDRTINLAGDFDASGGGSFTAGTGIVIFDGTTQSLIGGGVTFANLQFNNGTTVTVSGNLSLSGDWNAVSGSAFSATGTVSFVGSGTHTITSSGGSFGSLAIAGTGSTSLADDLDVNGDLTISSTLSTGNNNITLAGNWDSSSGSFAAGTGVVTFDGGAQNITSGSIAFNDLTLAGTGTKTLQDALNVDGNLTITSTLDVGADNAIAIAGDWTNNGTFTAGNGKVTFDGNGTSNVLGSATTLFYDIDVTGTTNVEIETTHSLAGTLTLVDTGSAFDADGSGNAGVFTLVSTNDNPATDGRIAAIPTPANFIGEVTVQRYMSSEGGIWRYLATPVSGLTVADWQTQFPITGNFTGADDLGGANLPSLYIYDETHTGVADSGWVAYPATANTEAINPGVGYSAFIRSGSGQVTVNQRGPVNKGNFNFSVTYTSGSGATHDGWNLLGNPYPSSLDWDALWTNGSANISATVHIRDNGGGGGQFATYNASTNTGTNGGTQYIAQGQSFWVQATAASPSLQATESMKATGIHEFFRMSTPENYIRIAVNDGTYRDETLIHFFDDALPGLDQYDAYKLKNAIFNLSTIMDDSADMVIQAIATTVCDTEVRLNLYNIAAGNYTLDFSELDSFTEPMEIYLRDNYTGTYNLVSNGYAYPFTVTADSASFGMNRFAVVFDKPAVDSDLLVSGGNICEREQAMLTVKSAENGVKYYALYNGTAVSDTLTGAGNDLLLTVSEPAMPGSFEYTIMADNGCGAVPLANKAVVEVSGLYEVTQVVGDQSCGPNSLTLKATGAPADGKYLWYNNMTDELPIAETTAGEYTTPALDSSHTFYVAIANALGCPGEKVAVEATVINLALPVVTLDTLDFRVYQLTSSYAQGNQWYLNGEPIPDATANTLVVNEPGIYTVQVTQSGCVVVSEDIDLDDLVTGLEDGLSAAVIRVAPNPFADRVEVDLTAGEFNLRKTAITIYDINGTVVYFNKKVKKEYNLIDLSGVSSGIYLLNVYDGEKGAQYKLVKK